ncbi:Alpha/beta hydrolase fold-1 [Phyllosticta citribraziliensis]|uniref:Alpha/beta hydrolase fold-1 n=1 Tax=Phyllosticta citribraziliensis TaxID=989973 RepID=A0ABR1M9V5_9PEZI
MALSVVLSSKPGAALRCSLAPPCPPHGPLAATVVVFLNGLLLPQTSWAETIDNLRKHKHHRNLPALVTYDRYGQGDSDPDPTDDPDTPYGHDARAVVDDLHQLLTRLIADDLSMPLHGTRLLFVANSIGCPIARLYAALHPGSVAGLLFLDSMMANADFVSLFPDPDSPLFDPTTLPANASVDDLRDTIRKYRAMFHPTVPNRERLDRRNLPALLPHAHAPKLPLGPGRQEPRLTVVGHDPDEFASQGLTGSLSIPVALTNAYVNPAWQAYNSDLVQIAGCNHVEGPIIAPKCGHFIQQDDPAFVARELCGLLDRLED